MKFNWKMGKDKWLIVLAVGLLLLVITWPAGSKTKDNSFNANIGDVTLQEGMVTETKDTVTAAAAAGAQGSYEEKLEQRVKQILKSVDGVGKVDVMIVLKSSEEKILRVDKNTTNSSTQEQDSGGGTRSITSAEEQESTILTGSGENTAPIVEKELRPEIEGIVVSAQGGASPTVKAEISGAMEALFNLPAHKIKVLKRVE